MSRLFTFFEILSHNLAFVCAPPPHNPPQAIRHTCFAYICASIAPLGQYDALRGYCLRQYTALYRPHRASAIRAPCYGYFAALYTPTPCAIAHAGNTRICARLSPRWGNTTLCAAIVCDNTPRSIARIAQTRYALHATAISLRSIRLRHALLPMRAIAHLCTAISLRSIRRASSAMRSIDCLHSIQPPTSPIYRPTAPTFSPLIARAPKTCPHPRHFLKIVEKKLYYT